MLACRGTWRGLSRLVRLLAALAVAVAAAEDDEARWREKVGWNEQVHGTSVPEDLAALIARVPYAYYPYPNQLEVLFDVEAAVKLLPADTPPPAAVPDALTVRVIAEADGARVWSGTMALDGKGRGRQLFDLPRLPVGSYRVQYAFGGVTLRASRTFTRSYFEFEHNTIGEQHEVYAPFTPVAVKGNQVSVIDRTYTVNAQGLFDSVVSEGRELLAAPMRLVVETADGEPVRWRTGLLGDGVKGRALYPDLAVFTASAKSDVGQLESELRVEEDGCAKIAMTLKPAGGKPRTIARAYLELALKETEAPLCHLVGMNAMRHNYAGQVPHGGRVTWINQAWRPARFEIEPFDGQAPASYEVWNANQLMHWGSERWNFAPYVWLGGETRGLAWFGDHTAGYATDGERGIQRLSIEPGRVVLRIELIQQPVVLDAPRTFVFGLQASPTKPMPDGWRGYDVPGGGGMQVNVWGGYNCAWHYPDPKDWRIVEKIVSARGASVDPNWDSAAFKAFFQELDGQRQFPDLKVHGRAEWLDDVLGFAGRVTRSRNGVTVYYEEFQTSGHHPESYEYMDEWDLEGWCRYRKHDYHWQNRGREAWGPQARTANQESWRDFAVYYADQWMQRGVGIYYDNTYPQTDRNPFNLRPAGVQWQNGIWGHRDYFRRVWKRSRELMAKGQTPLDPLYQVSDPERRMRLHIVGHVTNCQVLPYTTWWDATLGVESPGHWLPQTPLPAEEKQRQVEERGYVILGTPKKGEVGQALPYPRDYLRAMEMGRMAGLIPHYRHLLRGEDALGGLGNSYGAADRPPAEIAAHRMLSDKAMGLVHEIRGGGNPYDHDGIRALLDALRRYGYGNAEVNVHNYWAATPRLTVDHPDIAWIALERPGEPLLALLQSYAAEACEARLALPAGTVLLDLFTRRLHDGQAQVSFEADYGTRLFLVGERAALAPLAWEDDVSLRADFDFGLPPGWRSRGDRAPAIVEDTATPGNRVLRIVPGHPSQNWVSGTSAGDYQLTFRFRLPAIAGQPPHPQFYGFLQLLHRETGTWPKQSGQVLSLGIQRVADGAPTLAMTYGTRRDGQAEPFTAVTTDRLGKVGSLVPLDTGWHQVGIAVQGNRQTLSIDGHEVFVGETGVTDGGALVIGPGWGSWAAVPWAEIDNIEVRRLP